MNIVKICPKCQAVFWEEKWTVSPKMQRPKRTKAEKFLCPGCERIDKRRVDGVVYLRGDFLREHSKEALNLIKSVARKKRNKNIAARILSIERNPEGMIIQTTERSLAERIGKEFEKAYSGQLQIQWPAGSEFARVNWERD